MYLPYLVNLCMSMMGVDTNLTLVFTINFSPSSLSLSLFGSLSLPSPLFSPSAPPPRGLQTPNLNGGPPLPPRPSHAQVRRVSESPSPRNIKVPREFITLCFSASR